MEWLRASQLFVNVVQLGSFSAAGRQNGLSPASVSRIIRALEEDVGGRLLNRNSRKLNLTEAGGLYFSQLEQILQEITAANESVACLQSFPRGTLRVHSRLLIGNQYIMPALPGFMARYPEIKVELLMSNYNVDLVDQAIDVDIRIGELHDSLLIARKLVSAERVVCATPDFIARHGPISTPADLKDANCLTYMLNRGQPVWRFLDKTREVTAVPVSGSFQSDNGQALIAAAKAGLGVGLFQEWSVRDELKSGELVRILADYQVSHMEFENAVYAVFQQAQQVPTKIRVFIDHLVAYFKERAG